MKRISMTLLACGLFLGAAHANAEGDSGDGSVVEDVEAAHEDVKAEGGKLEKDLGMRPSRGQFGPAGCGLGSIVFEPDSGFTQVFAATLNGTMGSQTFGITTGTSNCDGTAGGSQGARAFVETNRTALAKDIARGGGETTASLSQLAGCGDAGRVGVVLQAEFPRLFPGPAVTDQQVGQNVLDVLQGDPTLGCSNLG